ncbi:phage tail spike protein [Bacillus sp. B15-48]|uniref:phage tail spike protein n=1 Tax=Bacillus sp. B15-48 TaxID=1548601 RepID=UPI00193EFC04|nr:phage tail spike protein [Bacillus sp. B15-48]MBM4762701.1 lysin [Bacillus sp. B15-48]
MYKVTLINDGVATVIHHPNFNDLKVQTGQIKQGINVADSFSFTILPNNPGYSQIRTLKTLITVKNTLTGKMEFDGRILIPTESMSESGVFAKSFVCESELGYLNDSCQRHGEYHDITVKEFLEVIIENHNRDVTDDPIDKTFVVGEVNVTTSTDRVYRYLGYENTFDSIDDKLVSRLGGEIRVRKENGVRYIDYVMPEKIVKQTEIRLAKNLKSITKEVDSEDIITRIIPLGERIESEDEEATDASQARITIESINDGKDFLVDEEAEEALGTIVVKSMVWDDVTQPDILKTRGQQYLNESNRVKVKHTLTALDLSLIGLDVDSFEVGYYYPVINPVMDIDEDLRVIGKTIDIINPNQNNLVIGDQFKKASEYQVEANKSALKVVELESDVNRQQRTISALKTELTAVDEAVRQVKFELEEGDLPALEDAIDNLNQAVDNLIEAIDDIPIYEPATHTEDGLMVATDKEKLDLISVASPIDLNDIVTRLEALENASGNPE